MNIPGAPVSVDDKMISIPVVSIEGEDVKIINKDKNEVVVNFCDSNLRKSSE